MTTAKHCMCLTKLCQILALPVHALQFWRIKYYVGNLHICLIMITTTFQIYKSWSQHHSNSTRTRTAACITQDQKGWRSRKLNLNTVIAHVGTGRPTTAFKFSDLRILCSIDNNQCCSCSLSRFGPTEVILTHLRTIRITQLRFVFLNFSFVCQNNLRWSKTR